jgi:serine/threonine-protein kinase RsbW
VNAYHLKVPAVQESVRVAADFVRKVAVKAGLDEQGIYHVEMSIDEACTNIIEHGFTGGSPAGEIAITCRLAAGRLLIDLLDDAPPFDPTAQEPPDPEKPLQDRQPGGWGIFFINRMMDAVAYDYVEGRNLLQMEKCLPVQAVPMPEDTPFPAQQLSRSVWLVKLEGRLDSTEAGPLESALMGQLSDGHDTLLLDMQDVAYISSSGLKVLLGAWRRAQTEGGTVALFGLQPRVKEVFEMSGFDQVFDLYGELAAAQEALGF